jgi:hypothetical protein
MTVPEAPIPEDFTVGPEPPTEIELDRPNFIWVSYAWVTDYFAGTQTYLQSRADNPELTNDDGGLAITAQALMIALLRNGMDASIIKALMTEIDGLRKELGQAEELVDLTALAKSYTDWADKQAEQNE